MAGKVEDHLKREECDKVRKEFRRGKRTVVINGIKCKMSRAKRTASKKLDRDTGKIETVKGKQYILVRPADTNRFVPVLQVEERP